MTQATTAFVQGHKQNIDKSVLLLLLQVLCAHLFGVTLLHEGETILGIVGSAAIAAGVVTVNSAKFATAEPAGPAEGARAGSLPQYSPVSTQSADCDRDAQPCPSPGSTASRSLWLDQLAAAAGQTGKPALCHMSSLARKDHGSQAVQPPQLAGSLPEHSDAVQPGRHRALAGDASSPVSIPVRRMSSAGSPGASHSDCAGSAGSLGSRSGPASRTSAGKASSPGAIPSGSIGSIDMERVGSMGSLGRRLGQATAVLPMRSPRLRRPSIELAKLAPVDTSQPHSSSQAQDALGVQADERCSPPEEGHRSSMELWSIAQRTSAPKGEHAEHQQPLQSAGLLSMSMRDQAMRRAAGLKPDAKDQARGQTLRDRELSFGEWDFEKQFRRR